MKSKNGIKAIYLKGRKALKDKTSQVVPSVRRKVFDKTFLPQYNLLLPACSNALIPTPASLLCVAVFVGLSAIVACFRDAQVTVAMIRVFGEYRFESCPVNGAVIRDTVANRCGIFQTWVSFCVVWAI